MPAIKNGIVKDQGELYNGMALNVNLRLKDHNSGKNRFTTPRLFRRIINFQL
jgi:predicted GIY-YIG superfamily endonuclease